MKKEKFTELLESRTLIADGAMGTMLYEKGVFIDTCFDHLNVTNEKLVSEIHTQYINAGADIIETNTFGANQLKLARFGLAEKIEQINCQAVKIAKKAAEKTGVLIAGAIGPLPVEITEKNLTRAEKIFSRQAKALTGSGVDLVILETFTNPLELKTAISAVSDLKNLPIIAQISVPEETESYYGDDISKMFSRIAAQEAVAAIGLNCSLGPSQMLNVLESVKNTVDKPLSVMPNAGLPQQVDGRNIYMTTPEYMAEYAKRFFEKGVRIIGGCCGTTPGHIRKISDAVKALDKAKVSKPHKEEITISEVKPNKGTEPVAFAERSKLAAKITSNQKVYCIEISPPKGIDLTTLLEKVKTCARYDIDAINIPDGPRASSRLSPIATAIKIQQTADIETLLHVCCRDKNLIAMQSDMLGNQALGIKNVLLITGDPPKLGQFPDASAVFDLDSVQLTKVVSNLNRGLDIAHNRVNPPLSLTLGVGLNPAASDIDREINRFKEKVAAGAEYAVTQPVFDSSGFVDFLKQIGGFKIPIIAGIWPLTSYKNAEFMANEVPGVFLPHVILKRMSRTEDKKEAVNEGIKIAKEMIDEIEPFVHGYAVSAPFGNVNTALAVLDKLDINQYL